MRFSAELTVASAMRIQSNFDIESMLLFTMLRVDVRAQSTHHVAFAAVTQKTHAMLEHNAIRHVAYIRNATLRF